MFSRTATGFHPTPKPVIWSYPTKEDKPRLNYKSHHSGPAFFIFLIFVLSIDVTPLNHKLYNRYRGIEGCVVINTCMICIKECYLEVGGGTHSHLYGLSHGQL